MSKKKISKRSVFLAGSAVALSLLFSTQAFAEAPQGVHSGVAKHSTVHSGMLRASGKVTAINGNTLTVTNKKGVVFTVDATNASIVNMKDKSPMMVSQVLVGDTVAVKGTMVGTNVTATKILDGVTKHIKGGKK